MSDPAHDAPFACPGHCASCARDRDAQPACSVGTDDYRGWRLAMASALAFVAPVAAAIALAAAVGGAVVGLARGALAAGPLVKPLRAPRGKELA